MWIIGAETIESRRDRWQSSIDGRGQQQQQQQQQQQRTRRGRMGGVRCRSERKKRKAGKKCVKNRQLKNCAGGRFARVSRVQFSIEIQLRFFLSYDIYFFWVWIHPFFLVIPPPLILLCLTVRERGWWFLGPRCTSWCTSSFNTSMQKFSWEFLGWFPLPPVSIQLVWLWFVIEWFNWLFTQLWSLVGFSPTMEPVCLNWFDR